MFIKQPFKWLISHDLLFLSILGISMAFCSFAVDFIIDKMQEFHLLLGTDLLGNSHWLIRLFVWSLFTIILTLFATVIVKYFAEEAAGSGIPEMRAILHGADLNSYLTSRVLITKILGLCAVVGGGLPVGKEGPFVHVASIMAKMVTRILERVEKCFSTGFCASPEFGETRTLNKKPNSEVISAACAVGVACTFGAPIGGVLFSIEVTAKTFQVHQYWRGFAGAVFSALMFRLFAVFYRQESTVVAYYRTWFNSDYPFDPEELIAV